MDTDWCLNCNCRTDGSDPYCSEECRDWAGPSTVSIAPYASESSSLQSFTEDEDIIYHRVDSIPKSSWVGHGTAGIRTWASMIPSGAPTRGQISVDDGSFSTFSCGSIYRPPKLLRRQRRVSPTVCMSTSTPPPSKPMVTPQQQIAAIVTKPSERVGSIDGISLWSSTTESPIATPTSIRASPISKKRDAQMSGYHFSEASIREKRPAHHMLVKELSYSDQMFSQVLPSL
ncbi:hypothetical protein AX17_007260 [Amanita inopinata Kibby_2008]|nr:hypothetical protein AX17_007260 [Amanita inopinata Kibby_2008]